MPFADEVGAKFGKFPFPKLRKSLEQLFAGDQRQHGIAQELHLFVVADVVLIAGLLRFLLPRLGTMCDRLLHDRTPPEVVAQRRFQRRNFPFFHDRSTTETNHNRNRPQHKQTAAVPRCAYFGGPAVCAGAVPTFNFVKRSFSARAAFPAAVSSLVNSTAWLAYFNASGILFCISSATASRKTAMGSTCCGKASIDLRKPVSASGHAFALNE